MISSYIQAMGKEIFILEDDKDISYILNYVLFEQGYRVRVYGTVSDLRQALRSGPPDLLLMDVRLPDGNGMDLCQELKQQAKFSPPILMMSADWHLDRADGCPADEYIAKPFDLDVVLSKVDCYLKQAG